MTTPITIHTGRVGNLNVGVDASHCIVVHHVGLTPDTSPEFTLTVTDVDRLCDALQFAKGIVESAEGIERRAEERVRRHHTVWRVSAADLDRLAGRQLTDEELIRAAKMIRASSVNEAAVEQVAPAAAKVEP